MVIHHADLSTLDRWCHKLSDLALLAAKVILLVLRLFSRCSKDRPGTLFEVLAVGVEVGRVWNVEPGLGLGGRRCGGVRYEVFRWLFLVVRRFGRVRMVVGVLESVGLEEVARAAVTGAAWKSERPVKSSRFSTNPIPEDKGCTRPLVPGKEQQTLASTIGIGDPGSVVGSPSFCVEDSARTPCEDAEQPETMCREVDDTEPLDTTDQASHGDADPAMLPGTSSCHVRDGTFDMVLPPVDAPDEQAMCVNEVQQLPKCLVRQTLGRHSLDADGRLSGAQTEEVLEDKVIARQKRPKPHRRCCSWPAW